MEMSTERKQATFIILGMHRSATSTIARGLHRAGIDMAPGKCHAEDLRFMKLNDRILRAAGGSWDDPPTVDDLNEVKVAFQGEIKELINERELESGGNSWGWKDPRTCLTIHLFKPFVNNPIYIPIFRDPVLISESLRNRDPHKFADLHCGIKLAMEYQNRVLEFLTRNKWRDFK